MRIFGLQIGKQKAVVPAMSYANTGGAFNGGWFGVVREGFAGAWQAVVRPDPPQHILQYSSVFSCVTLIAGDVAKLGVDLVIEDANGICTPAPATSPYWTVIRKPNHFQNRIRFVEQWVTSKLLFGNAYGLKERDARGIVTAVYVLDPQRVKPLVATNGDVYYELQSDYLSGLTGNLTVPATEIIHDRMNCLWHPLVGISPIYACAMSATTGNRIQANSATFFQNMSRPSGMLTAPDNIGDEVAARLKSDFEKLAAGQNIGRLFVAGNGLEYKPMVINAVDAQLIDQLRWTTEDIARCFHVPLFKIGGETGRAAGTMSVESLQQQYLNDCLQILIEDFELCFTEGLGVPAGYSVELDEDDMLRMDKSALFEALGKGVGAAILAPNEARKQLGLKPVAGGDSPLAQQQNFSLAALAKRDAKPDPFATDKPPPADPSASKDYTAELLADIAERAKSMTLPQITKEAAHAA